MPYAVITGPIIPQNADVILLARIKSRTGDYLTQATVSAIAYSVYDASQGANNAVALVSGSLVIASVIFNSLQVDSLWTKDSTG